MGSTRLLTNQIGNIVGTYTYDPYGNVSSHSGTTTTPLEFAGQYADPETGFVYLRVRYYDPGTAQFISKDPFVAITREPYQYSDENPENRQDPLGMATTGYCVDVSRLVAVAPIPGVVGLGGGGGLSACLVKSTNGSIGITVSWQAGLAVAAGHNLFGGISAQTSNATNLNDLGGFFAYATVGGAAPIGDVPAGPGLTIASFAGCDPENQLITGGQFGVGAGIAGASGVFGVSDTFYIHSFSGWQALAANAYFDILSATPSQLSFTALT